MKHFSPLSLLLMTLSQHTASPRQSVR